ncbi:Wzz/FepE/Etk N-terminal domain-containing protein [Butyrivibrio sp. AE3006]|uniref:Wzz/FepE/Etk N-terminal domain-containing protein n=1 Tax=Butyrivibrio sp. AE3006 TaxID=1280673 RepID=UPI0003F561C6|nr:Wzz/FepE/Etk N-terminal domain-containing protein [Butyrivibrio sp. AE3006]
MFKNELEIDVFRCIRALWKNAIYILIISILFFIAGFGLTLDKGEDRYGATASVYASAVNSYSDATLAVTAMNAYMDVAKSYKVCQRAALILGRGDIEADDIQSSVYVSSSDDDEITTSVVKTNSAAIISFTADTDDPEVSMAMADAMAQAYTIEMANILQMDAVKVLDNAHSYYVSHNALQSAWKIRIAFFIAGFVLACVAVIVLVIMDKRVRSIHEATIGDKLTVIGVIPDFKD